MLNALILQQQMLLEQKIMQTQAQIEAQTAMMRGIPTMVPQTMPVLQQQQQQQNVRQQMSVQQTKRVRQPLGDANSSMWDEEECDAACDLKTLIAKERLARNKISRLALTEAARLEMQLQNINIKKNSNRTSEDELNSFFSTPKKDPSTPQVVERDVTADGKPIYDFKPGTPGGMCVYFLKGFCSLGNKCRYVHDETDDGRHVKVTGMPYDVTIDVIINFFCPLKVRPENITFITSNGKPTGSAIIEFFDRKEALLSQSKDRAHITEARYVLLYPSSKKEKMWHLQTGGKHQTVQPMYTPSPVQPVMRQMVQPTPSTMGLTPSPMLSIGQMGPISPVSTVSSPVARKQEEEDETMRSLLSTLNEEDDEKVPMPSKTKDLPPIGTAMGPPPLINRMNTDDWLSHLQLSLSASATNQSIPSLITAPDNKIITALSELGYNNTACSEIIKALQEITAKAKLPLQNKPLDDLPSLLPMSE
eukprot:TRINITY_DN119_c6_g1_i1.p1 TRINITY_DN119_c6_g1~~TRINITY_DN119_c6_g1_i1.p1  ORF type:complete len:499 (+),score=117.03 TRINITY_DN119_c6_g1_i1:71-1498(+)